MAEVISRPVIAAEAERFTERVPVSWLTGLANAAV